MTIWKHYGEARGPSWDSGQPGATFNFIEKKGGSEAEGQAKVSFTDFGTERVDGTYSGPLSDGWYYSFGGFYRTSPGYRDPLYQGDRGGQAEFLRPIFGRSFQLSLEYRF